MGKRVENSLYLTKEEAAQMLRISLRTLCDWMAHGLVPYVKISRTVRFRRTDLEKVGTLFNAQK